METKITLREVRDPVREIPDPDAPRRLRACLLCWRLCWAGLAAVFLSAVAAGVGGGVPVSLELTGGVCMLSQGGGLHGAHEVSCTLRAAMFAALATFALGFLALAVGVLVWRSGPCAEAHAALAAASVARTKARAARARARAEAAREARAARNAEAAAAGAEARAHRKAARRAAQGKGD
ncbi:hypothetical protein ACQ5SO_08975 [Rhodovulum sp. DZ06]|uniref:hypothetical protein n=1 Tax=Rhodovulum sp. DZ06 TaxID=3425126 RepID=UPI003D339570